MSQEHLWKVIGRAKIDDEFSNRLFKNFSQTLTEENYQLDNNEIGVAQKVLSNNIGSSPKPISQNHNSLPQHVLDQFALEAELKREHVNAQLKRFKELSMYTVEILKNTLGNATSTYKTISRMNIVMFGVGIALFVFAAFYAVFSKEKINSLIFGGLGAASFISLFLLGSIKQSQNALSNLVQVEISFMSYFQQITFWDNYALLPKHNPPMPPMPLESNIERASEMLQLRSKEIIEMLQNYTETKDNNDKT